MRLVPAWPGTKRLHNGFRLSQWPVRRHVFAPPNKNGSSPTVQAGHRSIKGVSAYSAQGQGLRRLATRIRWVRHEASSWGEIAFKLASVSGEPNNLCLFFEWQSVAKAKFLESPELARER